MCWDFGLICEIFRMFIGLCVFVIGFCFFLVGVVVYVRMMDFMVVCCELIVLKMILRFIV